MPRRAVVVFVPLFVAFILSACSTTRKEGTSSSLEQRSRGSYYEFEDIQIPSELTLEKKSSFVYTASRIKVGLLTFTGRVEPDSLAAFFQNNLPRDGWRPISSLKFRQTMLVFLKEDRACVITIREKTFSTALEVWVGPIEQGPGPVKGASPR